MREQGKKRFPEKDEQGEKGEQDKGQRRGQKRLAHEARHNQQKGEEKAKAGKPLAAKQGLPQVTNFNLVDDAHEISQ